MLHSGEVKKQTEPWSQSQEHGHPGGGQRWEADHGGLLGAGNVLFLLLGLVTGTDFTL